MKHEMTTTPTNNHEQNRPNYTARRIGAGVLVATTLLGAWKGAELATDAVTPKEITSVTVTSDINPKGDIAEVQDALRRADIDLDTVSGVVGVGQELHEGVNSVSVKENIFGTWAELESDSDEQ